MRDTTAEGLREHKDLGILKFGQQRTPLKK